MSMVDYQSHFSKLKQRLISDLGDSFDPSRLNDLAVSVLHTPNSSRKSGSNDQYRSKEAKIPAYYNPNSHTIHLNVKLLEKAAPQLVENVYYHELVHASSHHSKMAIRDLTVLKSGLKIQFWDEDNQQTVIHRGLNEGLTQYFANHFTAGGPAYRNEVKIIGRLIRRLGLTPFKKAYFSCELEGLETQAEVTLGQGVLNQISALVDIKEYEQAEALIA